MNGAQELIFFIVESYTCDRSRQQVSEMKQLDLTEELKENRITVGGEVLEGCRTIKFARQHRNTFYLSYQEANFKVGRVM